MRTNRDGHRVPKLYLAPEEKAALRAAKLRAIDFVSLAPEEIHRATGGAIKLGWKRASSAASRASSSCPR
ncbi:MAG: hypothetical protein ACOX6T_19215 [Myxococcales bacterium]|jgi:hypothetical protein